MTNLEIATKKAELINHGKINIPKGLALPFYPSRSTAGPGAGRRAMVFGFGGTRVKLSIVRDGSATFSLVKKEPDTINKMDGKNNEGPLNINRECIQDKPYAIMKNGEIFLDNVSLEPTLMHAPNQAFINITSKCIYDCSFCVTPELEVSDKGPTPERWIELILNQAGNSNLQAIAITSGVARSPHETILDMVKIIKSVRERLPKIPIGVEPYVTSKDDIELLHAAGAMEIKINLETPNQEIFEKVCSGLDYAGIKRVLEHSVTVFGENKVCSNLIVGLGENDQEILTAVGALAEKGIVATLRGIRVNDMNRTKLTEALGFTPEPVPPERLVKLAEKQKEILEKYNLSTFEFKTMCHRCKCCDVVPQQDL
jgi:biotin synthase-related radical SAM superfamily protein